MRVLSGIQPSGALHLGNYFGMMQKMIAHQEEQELFCFIANYHAMTSLNASRCASRLQQQPPLLPAISQQNILPTNGHPTNN